MKKPIASEDSVKTCDVPITERQWLEALDLVQDKKRPEEKSVREIASLWVLSRTRTQDLLNCLLKEGLASVRSVGPAKYWSLTGKRSIAPRKSKT